MPTLRLTDRFIRNAPRPETGRIEYWDQLTPGFGLRVSASGECTWVVMYRVSGRKRRFTIGKLARYGLAEARELASDAIKQSDKGEDAALEKRLARRRGLDVESVADLLDAYELRRVPQLSERTAYETKRIIKRDLKPTLGHYEAAKLRKAVVAELLDRLVDDGAPMSARNAFKVIRQAYRWAAGERGILDFNPLSGLGAPVRDVRRDRVLTDDELRLLWAVWSKRNDAFSKVCQVLLYTGQRVQEVGRMRWSELDLDGKRWLIAPERYKTRIAHLVPLTDVPLAIIKSVPEKDRTGYVFNCGRAPRATDTVTGSSVDDDVAPLGGWSKAKARMDADANAILRKRAIEAGMPEKKAEEIALTAWRLQDLRRTARTLMSRAGVAFEHAERVVGHVIPGVAAVYDRHAYQDEKRAALQKLAGVLTAIVTQLKKDDDNVATRPASEPKEGAKS